MSRLGGILAEIGRAPEAEPLLHRALEIRQRVMTEGDPLLAKTKADLGDCLLRLGKTDEAERLLQDVALEKGPRE